MSAPWRSNYHEACRTQLDAAAAAATKTHAAHACHTKMFVEACGTAFLPDGIATATKPSPWCHEMVLGASAELSSTPVQITVRKLNKLKMLAPNCAGRRRWRLPRKCSPSVAPVVCVFLILMSFTKNEQAKEKNCRNRAAARSRLKLPRRRKC